MQTWANARTGRLEAQFFGDRSSISMEGRGQSTQGQLGCRSSVPGHSLQSSPEDRGSRLSLAATEHFAKLKTSVPDRGLCRPTVGQGPLSRDAVKCSLGMEMILFPSRGEGAQARTPDRDRAVPSRSAYARILSLARGSQKSEDRTDSPGCERAQVYSAHL